MLSHNRPLEIEKTYYHWQPRPVNVWVSRGPYNALQAHVLGELRGRLEAQGCVFVESLSDEIALKEGVQLGVVFGRDMDEEISPLALLGRMPKPRGSMLIICTVERLPDVPLFDLGRGQLVKKAGHFGIIVEGNLEGRDIERVLWVSMAGNNRLLTGDEAHILDGLALRIQAHVGAEKCTTHAGDVEAPFTWDEWCASPVHADIARAARALGRAGLIENEVPLAKYASGKQTRSVLRFLNRAALGEGMRSQLDPHLRIMGVTASGGNKVKVSPDPADGHVIPVSQLTGDGYVRAIPRGCPVSYVPPSVETHENGMVYLGGALVNAGLVNSFDTFLEYVADQLTRRERIDILPEGMQPKVTAIEHFHRQPRLDSIKEPERVEIVYPDTGRFPEIDFPCGVREAELHLLSAVFSAESFRRPGRLGNKAIIAVLPGHGSVALYAGPRAELVDLLVNGMEMEEVVRV